MAVVARKSASALQVKVMGPAIRAVSVMAEIHSDFTGCQRTTPSMASVSSASNMRGERRLLSDLASASSTGSSASPSRLAVATPHHASPQHAERPVRARS